MSMTTVDAAAPSRADDSRWAVETHGLTKRFKDNVAVDGVELLVPRGCAFGYLGPNGAGKTTLIRVLLGLTHADAGTMSLLGFPVPQHRDRALARMGAIVDEPRFHGHLTGRQNLAILAAAREPAARGRIGPSLERVGIAHRADDKVSKYSMGMRQRLGVAACLLGDPQLLILDEPMNGLDPAGMLEMREMILSLVAEGRTVVLSSHLLDEVERTCDAVAIVDHGKVIRQGPISELLAGSAFELQIDCSAPDRAAPLLAGTRWGAGIGVGPDGLRSTWSPAPTGRWWPSSTGSWSRAGSPSTASRRSMPRSSPGSSRSRPDWGSRNDHLDRGRSHARAGDGPSTPDGTASDRRGSWLPNGAMIATRMMELRKRRGLMITLVVVNIGIPTVFLVVRLLAHAFAPHSYGPAGGYDIFTSLVAGVMFLFGFIVAATLGCTAGSDDLTDGMFRHLVVTGRSRLALYLARIPAGLAIIVPLVAVGFTIVCAVCVFAAPTQLEYNGVTVPAGLSHSAFEAWAGDHADEVICQFTFQGDMIAVVPCGNGPGGGGPGLGGGHVTRVGPGGPAPQPTSAAVNRTQAIAIADQDYTDYSRHFLSPPISLMVKAGLWLELYAGIGFVVGLGLASLMGQRTVPVILLIVLEIVLTPLLSQARIAHLLNLQRGLVGLAASRLEPGALPSVFGGVHNGGPGVVAVPESVAVAVCVIIGWIVVWTALGAWRMVTRDA